MGPARRGVAVLVVLLLLSITLGLSYAMVRSQTTALQIQQNANVRVSAREAALTGLTVGLKKMHTSAWCYGDGVNTTLTGSIGDDQSYQVSYAAGDPALAATDPDYRYRVTLLSTGTAIDPADPERSSKHQARAVVQLRGRKLAAEPQDWNAMQQYTVYQAKMDVFELDIPCRLEGRTRIQGQLKLAVHYPNNANAWSRYLTDLNAMRLNGGPDCRPFNGPVDLPFLVQTGVDLTALVGKLNVTAINVAVKEAASDWTNPSWFPSYQIYPGGPLYAVTSVGLTLQDTTLEPDPLTNPLGLFYRSGSVLIRDNVTIRGSLFCQSDIRIDGANVHFESLELPPLEGKEGPVRLPAATCEKLLVERQAGGDIRGLVAVFNELKIAKSPDTVSFAVVGRVVARKFLLKEREPWETLDWSQLYTEFDEQLTQAEGPVVTYFPVWLGTRGLDPQPRITFKADPSPVTYHWKQAADPIYVPHPDDGGLRWEVVEWTDSP